MFSSWNGYNHSGRDWQHKDQATPYTGEQTTPTWLYSISYLILSLYWDVLVLACHLKSWGYISFDLKFAGYVRHCKSKMAAIGVLLMAIKEFYML